MSDRTPAPLTEAEWERLRARIAFCGWERAVAITDDLAAVVADLLAAARADEREAARAEVARSALREADLVRALDAYRDGADDIVAERDTARANALRAALSAFPDCMGCFEPGHPCGDPVCAARDRVRAAVTTVGDRTGPLFYVDAITGEPCPTDGSLLCTVADWKNHLHRDGRSNRG